VKDRDLLGRDTAFPIGVNLRSNPFREYYLAIKARFPLGRVFKVFDLPQPPLKRAGRFHSLVGFDLQVE
jgi:hypothetical protein